jgi:iron(III) transport system ATP-binding protein
MTAPAIKIEALSKRYDQTSIAAVSDVTIHAEQKDFLVLLGGSGSGKTTLLRMLAGLEIPDAGRISIDGLVVADAQRGVFVEPAARGIGMVFQSYALWPHMRVRDNIDWPLRVAGWSKAKRADRMAEVLTLTDIEALADRLPHQLSGGQQQRVAIARAIAPRPRLLLLDEPLSALDAKLRGELRSELARMHSSTGATSVLVTHDQIEAITLASKIAVLDRGRLAQLGTPHELLTKPANVAVASLVGMPPGTLLPIEHRDNTAALLGTYLPMSTPKTAAKALYRPESLSLADKPLPHTVGAEVIEVAPFGHGALVTLMAAGCRVTLIAPSPGPRPGERVNIAFPARPAAIYDKAGDWIDSCV